MAAPHKQRRRVIVALILALVLAVVLPPFVNANLFRARLARSVSGALGRNVTMGDVKIRLLPLPGFQIENFVIGDDPAFSAEPMLRAESVTARLRLTSLWRGKLEIARLSLSYPSLNLVRNADGRWNIEGLLAHASQVSAAPTATKKPEARPRFPYIEADSGRINFKVLQEKKAHVLVETDFALWQEAENQWNMRLEGRPTRTDENLGDTGTLRMEGSFQRAGTLENTPIKLTFDWQKAQLGQLTALMYGRDRGWRADVRVNGELEGTPRQFVAKASIQLNDFHRYDIATDDALRLTAECTANHAIPSGAEAVGFRNHFTCRIPMSAGAIEVNSYGQYWWQAPQYLSVRATGIPVADMAQIYRRAKRDVPKDITGSGMLNAYFSRITYPNSASPRWIGQGAMTNVVLSSPSLAAEMRAENIHFGFNQVETSPEGPNAIALNPRLKQAKVSRTLSLQPENVFTVDPFQISVADSKPLSVSGANSGTGLHLDVKGENSTQQLMNCGHLLGLQTPPAATAAANAVNAVDLDIDAHWANFAAPIVSGVVKPTGRAATTHTAQAASNQQHAKTP